MEGSKGVVTITPSEVAGFSDEKVASVTVAVKQEIKQLKQFMATLDAESVVAATRGLGTNEERLIDVLCSRTKSQMDSLSAAMVSKTNKTLLQVVKSEVSGNFGKLVGYSLMDVDDFGAQVFSKAVKGMGTDEAALIDLCMTHSNEELKAIKLKWEARNDGSLVDTLRSEFGTFSKHARNLFLKLFLSERGENPTVDAALAESQADKLHKAGVAKRLGTDEEVFINILVSSSREQVQAIKQAYEKKYSMSLQRAIEKEMSGTLEKGLVALLQPSVPAYIAYALYQAFDGIGCDRDRVCRLLGGADKKLLPDISARFLDVYGKTIQECLKDETTVMGDFKAAATQWVMGSDPTKRMEFVTPPSEPKELLKHLLQERENIRDHLARDDAQRVYYACKGFGTDDNTLISVICSRPKLHLERVDRHFHALYHESLRSCVEGDCSGDYKRLLTSALTPQDKIDAEFVKKACDGIGTNEAVLVELFAPRSNARIQAMKQQYEARYGQPLVDRLNSELSGHLKKVIIELLKAQRDENEVADEELARVQASKLHEAGVGKWGTDEAAFIETLCRASRTQIEAIKASYESQYGMSLRKAIEKETSGDFERTLVALTKSPVEFYVGKLRDAFKGFGTDEGAIVRVLGGHDKNDLKLISEAYLETTGHTLTESLKKEISGKFLRACLTWVSSADPLELSAIETAVSAHQDATEDPSLPPSYDQVTGGRAPSSSFPMLSAGNTLTMSAGQAAMLPENLMDEIWMGLGWETPGGKVDLDAGVVCLDAASNVRGIVFYGRREEPGIYHSGDSRTGDGKGDDEVIRIKLSEIKPEVTTLVLTVHCYNEGQSFSLVNSAYVRLSMPATGHVCAEFRLGSQLSSPGVMFAMLRRAPGCSNWIFASLGRGVMGNAANTMDTVRAVQAMSASTAVRFGNALSAG
jgi:stress response protein SCP2